MQGPTGSASTRQQLGQQLATTRNSWFFFPPHHLHTTCMVGFSFIETFPAQSLFMKGQPPGITLLALFTFAQISCTDKRELAGTGAVLGPDCPRAAPFCTGYSAPSLLAQKTPGSPSSGKQSSTEPVLRKNSALTGCCFQKKPHPPSLSPATTLC